MTDIAKNEYCEELHSTNPAFNGFWDWLRTERLVPTLAGQSTVKGCTDSKQLYITTSNNEEISPILKVTVAKYCTESLEKRFEGLEANIRWVAAFLKEYLDDWAKAWTN